VEASESFPSLKIGFVDWDSQIWRRPLTHAPVDPQDLFEPIAYRLAQLYGPEIFRNYWLARSRVASARQNYQEFQARFENSWREHLAEVRVAKKSQDVDNADYVDQRTGIVLADLAALRTTLMALGCALDDAVAIVSFRERMTKDRELRDQVFQEWAEQVGGSGGDSAAVRPFHLLADALQRDILTASERNPLLLVLDTCELLSPELDYWLRLLVIGALSQQASLVVLIGSRLRPDSGVAVGTKDTWMAQLGPGVRRIISFGDDFRFSPHEIGSALALVSRQVPDNPDLELALYKVTRGIPLAVRAILDLHETGEDVLNDLSSLEADSDVLDDSEAARVVTEAVTRRWLSHLEGSRGAYADLEDIVALTLLRRPNSAVLKQLWTVPDVRLRELSNKYSLLTNGNLHQTVREFLRRRWRSVPIKEVAAVSGRLDEIFNQLEPDEKLDSVRVEWLLDKLNIESWRYPERTPQVFARFASVILASGLGGDALADIGDELGDSVPRTNVFRTSPLFYRYSFLHGAGRSRIVEWLDDNRKKGEWSPLESASLDLVRLLYSDADGATASSAVGLCSLVEKVLGYFGEAVPQPQELTRRYMMLAFKATLDAPNLDVAERAYEWARKTAFSQEGYWFAVGNLLHNLKRYADAESAYRKAWDEDPDGDRYPALARVLGHVLAHHLERIEEGVEFFEIARQREPFFSHLPVLLSELYVKLGRFDMARRSLEGVDLSELEPSERIKATVLNLRLAASEASAPVDSAFRSRELESIASEAIRQVEQSVGQSDEARPFN
jgi:tetratricopeptide (TPR) repeat protein